MRNTRLISRLDVKGPNLIKGMHLEGLRVLGRPQIFAKKYYQEGIDEIVYMDVVASLYGRNSLHALVSETARDVFVPITVGGGIRSIDDVSRMLSAGADKVALNTALNRDPELINQLVRYFGSQCIVLSVEAKLRDVDMWEVYVDNGREPTGKDVLDWVKECEDRGVGEIILTSVDREGTRKGFDDRLVRAVTEIVDIPVIASGGMGSVEHATSVVLNAGADAIAIADMLHYDRIEIPQLKLMLREQGLNLRP